jgi:hypothetical protein
MLLRSKRRCKDGNPQTNGKREGILQRKKQKKVTLDRRFHYNLGPVARQPQGEL